MYINPQNLFEKYIKVLESFAQKHNASLEKYRHGAPSCNLTYRRKDKGYCNIQVLISEEEKISIFGLWEYLSREELKKYVARISKIELKLDLERLNNELEYFFTRLNAMSDKDIQEIKDISSELNAFPEKDLDVFFDGTNYPVCKP